MRGIFLMPAVEGKYKNYWNILDMKKEIFIRTNKLFKRNIFWFEIDKKAYYFVYVVLPKKIPFSQYPGHGVLYL